MKLAIVFHRFGPYHWARLKAVSSGFDLLAIEQSAETTEYLWNKVEGEGGFQRTTLFPDGESEKQQRVEIGSRMSAALDAFAPKAVAIPGWSTPGALSGLRWCLRTRVPAIVLSESTARDAPRSAGKEWLKRRVLNLCSAALVGGTRHREYVEVLGMPGEKVFLGYDAVDNRHFSDGADEARRNAAAVRKELELPERYFLASSRFLPQKNLFMLLEAFAVYRRTAGAEGSCSLVLLGDGALRQGILRHRDRLGLGNAVMLPGFQQYDELPKYYGLAQAFVHAATSEPWGLVVNEAMASGLPVIVSEHCGCAADLVQEECNGFLFNPQVSGELSEALTKMAGKTEAEREAFSSASRTIIAEWGLERFRDCLQEAVREACARTPRRATALDRFILRRLAAR